MATAVIMPALGMAQETGRLIRWLKQDGESVTKGEPLMEIETDKATVEIEAPATGLLGNIQAREGEDIPVGQAIAWVLAPGENPAAAMAPKMTPTPATVQANPETGLAPQSEHFIDVSVLARNIAAEHSVDLSQIRPRGKRIEKADVLAFIQEHSLSKESQHPASRSNGYRLLPASPKARRLAQENGLDLSQIHGSGPGEAVLVADVLDVIEQPEKATVAIVEREKTAQPGSETGARESISTTWRLMADRTTSSWTGTPHFYLMREVNAARLVQWRDELSRDVEAQAGVKLTYTDLLVKLIANSLQKYPRLLSTWDEGAIIRNSEINISLAVAVEDGLVAPVIHQADRISLSELAKSRKDLVERAQTHKLRPSDLEGGLFTLTNLGMYNVDAFNAIINSPQAAILAVGRIADRVIAVEGQPAVRPTIILSLSCDHRLVDGARGAQFLDELSKSIENPWRLMI